MEILWTEGIELVTCTCAQSRKVGRPLRCGIVGVQLEFTALITNHVGNRMAFLHEDFLCVSDPYWHASVPRRESSRKSRHENIKSLLH